MAPSRHRDGRRGTVLDSRRRRHDRRLGVGGFSHWGVVVFLVAFLVVVVVVSYGYLFPALTAAQGATPEERRRLAAYSTLLLCVVLFCLLMGLLLSFRFGRMFFPRASGPKVRTKYVDAWAEAGRRMTPPEDKDKTES